MSFSANKRVSRLNFPAPYLCSRWSPFFGVVTPRRWISKFARELKTQMASGLLSAKHTFVENGPVVCPNRVESCRGENLLSPGSQKEGALTLTEFCFYWISSFSIPLLLLPPTDPLSAKQSCRQTLRGSTTITTTTTSSGKLSWTQLSLLSFLQYRLSFLSISNILNDGLPSFSICILVHIPGIIVLLYIVAQALPLKGRRGKVIKSRKEKKRVGQVRLAGWLAGLLLD